MSFETTVLLLTWVAILLLAFVVSGLVRRVHFMNAGAGVQPDHLGLAQGTAAPEFTRFSSGTAGRTLLLFLDRDCGVCPGVLEESRTLLTESAEPLTVVALFSGPAHDEPAGPIAVLAAEAATFEKYEIPAVPFAVLVDAKGRIETSQPVGSPGVLRALLTVAQPVG